MVTMPSVVNEVKKIIDDYSSFSIVTELNDDVSGYDVIGIVGTDKFIIMNLHKLNSWEGPVLTVGFGLSFLNSVDITNLDKALSTIVSGNYDIEEILRLSVNVKGKKLPNAINEIAIFPARSAITLEYSLYVNNEYLWHDVADGLIISTPTGSTAYAMSAGGPLIHSRAQVFEIVPVNSTNLARVPVIVPSDSIITIRDLISRSRVEVIIDGSIRTYVGNEVKITSGKPLKLIRLVRSRAPLDVMKRK